MNKQLIEFEDGIVALIEAEPADKDELQLTASTIDKMSADARWPKIKFKFSNLLTKNLKNIGQSVKQAMSELQKDGQTDVEATVELGFGISAEGKIYIAELKAQTHLKVTLKINSKA